MTAATAVPMTVPRLARGTVARRALAVVLFIGGLLALGLLLGGPAHAADQSRTARPAPVDDVDHAGPAVTAERLATAHEPAAATGGQVTAAGREAEEAAKPAIGTAAAPVTNVVPVTNAVPVANVAPVRNAVPVTNAVPVANVAPVTSAAPVTNAAPVAKVVPGVTEGLTQGTGALPGVPSPSGLPDLPGLPAVPPAPLPQPGPGAPLAPPTGTPGTPGGTQADATARAAVGPDTGRPHTQTPALRPAVPDAPSAGTDVSAAHHAAHPATAAVPATVTAPHITVPSPPSAPGPCGGTVRQSSAADGSGPRPGDQHAMASPADASSAPARGTARPATAAPLRDRPHSILEFPG
ncbi:hypothetical protein [Streptomyces lavendofoliae]|uniref:hypothetical protein n=1 Tax=Streptomyces lavendofoliae TaxID=67314 RepID=UPI00300F24BF